MEVFPKSHIVTFKYYVGLIHFLDENYAEVNSNPGLCPPLRLTLAFGQAEEHLAYAWNMCHKDAVKNRE